MNTEHFSFAFHPALPAWLLWGLAGLALAVTALAVLRRARGAVLRALAAAALLATAAGPVLDRETRHRLASIALLVIDRSASMQTGNRASLADTAAKTMTAEARAIPGLELRTVTVPEHGTAGTRLFEALRQASADIPADRLAGVLAITDGQVHDVPAEPPGAPFHALLAGRGEEWDRRIRVVEAPPYGIVGRSVDLKIVVEDLGRAPPAGPAHLTIRRDGDTAETRDVAIGAEQTIPIDITREGPTLIDIETDPVPGEASPVNNRAIVEINGVRDRLRVLLVSGEPNQGERVWRRLLKSDPAVDLVHFTILRPPEKDDTTPLNELALIAFPTRELFQDKLSGFDLIILDRFTDRGILPHLYLQNIAEYVRRGGALLLTVGPEFATPSSLDQTPLSEVLPAHAPISADGVDLEKFRPRVTALGARHPVTQDLPGANRGGAAPAWGDWYRAIVAEDVHGQVLMTGPGDRPLLILDHVEQGRAALLMSDQIWLWSRGHEGGGPHAELLRRVAHWLMKQPALDEERLEAALHDGKLTVTRHVLAENAAAPITLTDPGNRASALTLTPAAPGIATSTIPAPALGVWQASDGTHRAFAVAGEADAREFADLHATAAILAPVTGASGGSASWLGRGVPALRLVEDGAPAAGPGWIGLRRGGAHVVTGVAETPLLPPFLSLPLLAALVLAGWWRERQ